MQYSKDSLRRKARQHSYTSIEQEQCMQTLLHSSWFEQAKHIFTYIALPREIQTITLIERAYALHKNISIPHIDWEKHTMHMCRLEKLSELEHDRYGLYKPNICKVETSADMAIVPCLMVALDGTRLGTGGGYYDHFFSEHYIPVRLAVSNCPGIPEYIPSEKHDIAVTHFLTPEGVYAVQGKDAIGD